MGMDNSQYILNLNYGDEVAVCTGHGAAYRFQVVFRQDTPVQFVKVDDIVVEAVITMQRYTIPEGQTSVYLLVLGDCGHVRPTNRLCVDEGSLTLIK